MYPAIRLCALSRVNTPCGAHDLIVFLAKPPAGGRRLIMSLG